MSGIEPNFESEQPLVDKKMLNGSGDGSNATNGYNHRSGNVAGDVAPQNLKNHQLEANYRNQQQMLEAKLAKLQIRFYVLGGITILGFVILIILTAVFFTLLHSNIAHHTHKPKLGTQMAVILEEGVCVACEDYRLGASAEEEATLDKFIDESTEGSGLIKCCVDTPGELLELLKLVSSVSGERRWRERNLGGGREGFVRNGKRWERDKSEKDYTSSAR
ncbi:tnf ligand-like 2 [Plakobranchus ocellatus]|uniref:Tnf ligand-like 2 n=1 Tax=Plakobranchus ocellatus TaxID=259542 RepID=A0AAV4DX13_9GAST|nr:tnf ligand-like 2 [Plakobranchus ocellatus]